MTKYRTDFLGLELRRVFTQLIEEPDDDKAIGIMLWNQRDTAFVWSTWAYIDGPVPSALKQEGLLPLIGFWPNDKMNGRVAEIFDATQLTAIEQGQQAIDIPKGL